MPAVGHFARYITINASCWTKFFTVRRAKGGKKKADQQADFWQLEGLEFPLMTVKCCKCFAVNHVCCNDLGVCVGSTPLTYSICHHVTHLPFNYQHLWSPRELPSFRFLYLLTPVVRVAGVCWSPSQLSRGKGKLPVRYRATVKDKPPLTLTNPTTENFANHRNSDVEIICEKSSAPRQFGDSREETNHSIGFNCLNPTHVSGQFWINSPELWGSMETEIFSFFQLNKS